MYEINILRNGCNFGQYKIRTADLRTADCELRTGYKTRTEYKMQTEFKTMKTSVLLYVVIAFESMRLQNNYLRGLYSTRVSVCPNVWYRVTTGNKTVL